MSQTQNKAMVDQILTNASMGIQPEGCIADGLFPVLKHAQYTGKLMGYGKNHLRIENTISGGKGAYRLVEPIVTNTTGFDIETHGLKSVLTKKDFKNKTDPAEVELDEVMGLRSLLKLSKEHGLSTALRNVAVVTQNVTLSGSSQFSDKLNSDPLETIRLAKKAVRDAVGKSVNTAIIPYDVAELLRIHPQLLDFLGFKLQKPGGLTNEDLMRAFDVKRLLIPDVKYNAAKEGQADSLIDMWGRDIVLGVIPEKAEKWQVSAGYQVLLDDGQPYRVYKTDQNEPPNSVLLQVEDEYDQLIAEKNALFLIKDSIAS